MTDKEKQIITLYREQGMSYTKISTLMDISINSIKTYCKRHSLGGIRAHKHQNDTQVLPCDYCGMPVIQNPGRKRKRFCNDRCRNAWWREHSDLVKKKANYDCVCINCGKHFIAYGNKERKYCSHECYIADRFGGK
ncbi:sigma factor-like helix-turn-helix DNA-binding protein [Catenibacterium mitsuokai]|uniref:sigma factor-like helix-turn-helix DNA-binding protein n=1 Tax=Catenibacterium mitsuokai TaxID=100886 RepID=UPI003F9287F7